MTTMQYFLSEFWPTFIVFSIVMPALWMGKIWSLDGHLPFVRRKSFAELSDFAEDQQQQLLHDASKEASRRWRSLVPFLIFTGMFATGGAIGRTLPKLTTVPDSFLVHVGFTALFTIVGVRLAARVEVRQLRPFLKDSIKRVRHAA